MFTISIVIASTNRPVLESRFDTSRWNKYTSTTSGISFLYPNSYQITESKNSGNTEIEISSARQDSTNNKPWMRIAVIENSTNTNYYLGYHMSVTDRINIKDRQWLLYSKPFSKWHIPKAIAIMVLEINQPNTIYICIRG